MSLTCITCKVLFATSSLQREHYKSDWHRYNLKRKIAELPVVTKEEFDEKAAAHQQTLEKDEFVSSCDLCRKRFVSKNSMMNHLKSKKHLEAELNKKQNSNSEKRTSNVPSESSKTVESKAQIVEDDGEYETDDSDWESCDDDDDGEGIPPCICIFCNYESDSIEANVSHMTQEHSFFIPDIEYLTDIEGLISYLGEKVGSGHVCLWCNRKGKHFKSAKDVQQHMRDKGHCKMLHEGEAVVEYADFYDYTSSYPEASDENADEEVDIDQLDSDNYQLVLPSGAVVGHRSLALYYRQNLKPVKPENKKAVSKIMQHYKALGWTGTSGEAAIRKAKDITFMRKIQSKRALKLGVKQNKFQPHFRPQVMF